MAEQQRLPAKSRSDSKKRRRRRPPQQAANGNTKQNDKSAAKKRKRKDPKNGQDGRAVNIAGRRVVLDDLEEISRNAKSPPEGYIFVPTGDVFVSRHCRTATKEAGQTVYLVYDYTFNPKTRKRTSKPIKLGLHVPNSIYQQVLTTASSTASTRAKAVAARDSSFQRKARETLSAKFPSIPADDAEQVLQRAYRKGSGNVGRTGKIGEERKVRLAVEAHVRHKLTEYDELLSKGVRRDVARERVWGTVKRIRDEWMGGVKKMDLASGRKRQDDADLKAARTKMVSVFDDGSDEDESLESDEAFTSEEHSVIELSDDEEQDESLDDSMDEYSSGNEGDEDGDYEETVFKWPRERASPSPMDIDEVESLRPARSSARVAALKAGGKSRKDALVID